MYNYKGLTVNWETKDCTKEFEGKTADFSGLGFTVIDNYGSIYDMFEGAYGIDIKPDAESIKDYIRNHIDRNQEKYKEKLIESDFNTDKLNEEILRLDEKDRYKVAYHLLAPLDRDGSLLYETASELTQITPKEIYRTVDEQKLFDRLPYFELIKYAEAGEFGNLKYENDILTEFSVYYDSEEYRLYENDLYSDTVDKMLMSEMSLEDMLEIQHNILNYKCREFSYNPLHPDKETTYIVQDDIEKAEAYRQSMIYKELPESRARQILAGALDYLSELLKGQELYNVLSGSVGMTHEEMDIEGFTLQDYYEEETEDDEEVEI